jgi:hypothetical protein
MTKESLIVHNPNHEDVTFRLDKGLDDSIAQLAYYKQKKLIRAFSYNARVPSRQSVDLVALSGLTLKEVKNSAEFIQMLGRLTILYDSSKPEETLIDEREKESVELDSVEVEDIDPVLPEDEIEHVEDELHPEGEVPDLDAVEKEDVITEDEVVAELPVEDPEVEEPEVIEPPFDAVNPEEDLVTQPDLEAELKLAQKKRGKRKTAKKTSKKTTKATKKAKK